jgi:hypothetical protein
VCLVAPCHTSHEHPSPTLGLRVKMQGSAALASDHDEMQPARYSQSTSRCISRMFSYKCVGLQNASTSARQMRIAVVTQGVFACLSACLSRCVRTREALGEQGSPFGRSIEPRSLSPRAKAAMESSSSSGYVCFFNTGCAPLAQSVHSGV